MNRYEKRFRELAQEGRGAFIPFTVLGFPDRERCAEQLELLATHADAVELGIPFSDPVADGPVIQHATAQALRAGATLTSCFALVAELRARYPELPIGLLTYANPVIHRGPERFYAEVAAAGADSVLIADVPSEEGEPFAAAAHAAGVAPVFIAPPNADDGALERIARLCGGYTYVLTRGGVTGTERAAGRPAAALMARLLQLGAPPPVLGFGISTPQQVCLGIAAGAAGVISGSAIVERLRDLVTGGTDREKVTAWLSSMHNATLAYY